MAKYLVETYYNCSFKVSHYLDEVNSEELQNLEKRDDGKFEILDVKLDNRKTRNLDVKNQQNHNKFSSFHSCKERSTNSSGLPSIQSCFTKLSSLLFFINKYNFNNISMTFNF